MISILEKNDLILLDWQTKAILTTNILPYNMILKNYLRFFAAALCAAVVACSGPKDVEVGPYTVSVIEDNVYHIQDYNSSNPAGEEFDAEGNKTHFNNCSDIYLIVGEKEAQDGTVAVRPQGGGEQSVMTIQQFIDEVNAKVAEMTKDF